MVTDPPVIPDALIVASFSKVVVKKAAPLNPPDPTAKVVAPSRFSVASPLNPLFESCSSAPNPLVGVGAFDVILNVP